MRWFFEKKNKIERPLPKLSKEIEYPNKQNQKQTNKHYKTHKRNPAYYKLLLSKPVHH